MGPVFSKGFCCVLIFSWSEYYTSSDSGGEGKSKQAEKYGTKKSKERREEPQGKCLTRPVPNGRVLLYSSFFTFLRAMFFRLFGLSLAPTLCPWVSEDEYYNNHSTNINFPFLLKWIVLLSPIRCDIISCHFRTVPMQFRLQL